jgi:catechol 2,3-dioxygenase-like lactoylglutathione lyase family enzyme
MEADCIDVDVHAAGTPAVATADARRPYRVAMNLQRVDPGFVSTDRSLVDFLAEVLELEELAPIELEPGTIYRLQAPGAIVKVMVPSVPPKSPEHAEPFYALSGLRYLTLWVADLDRVIERAVLRGARLERGPMELVPGIRFAVFEDPEGNAIEIAQAS